MLESFYVEYSQIEDTHWWFRGRREIFTRLLAPLAVKPLRMLDIGFGTGAMLKFLAPYGSVTGMDMSADAIRFARRRVACPMLLGSITNVPLASASFDLVTAFDIVEHVEDDRTACAELARVCRPGGAVVIFVPALQILWGWQDEVSHHRRRYRAGPLRAVVEGAGLRVTHVTYFNTLLFAPILAARLALRVWRPSGARNENELGGPVANAVLGAIFAAEAPLLRRRLRLPIGVSLACVATRPRR